MNGSNNGLVSLLREGIIAQALLGTVVWLAIIYQVLDKQTVNEALLVAGSAILGYYFRTENKQIASNGGH